MNIFTSIFCKIFGGSNKKEERAHTCKGCVPKSSDEMSLDKFFSLYSFCEASSASSSSPWHIRKLTPDVGRKLGGGVDTYSLCGFVRPHFGWDIQVPITTKQLGGDHICKGCLTVLSNLLQKDAVELVKQWEDIFSD